MGWVDAMTHHERINRLVAEVRAWTTIVEDRDENQILWRVRRVSKPGAPEWVKDYAEGRTAA